MFIVPVFRFTYRITKEKETRVRESMEMMGLTEMAYWSSWLASYTIINTFISVVSTIILHYGLLKFSSSFLVFLFFWLYGLSLFGFILFCQSFFE
jgi:ATP-binding cassette subfamily A (ABC1) protein 3